MLVYNNSFTDDLGTRENYLDSTLATQQLLGILLNNENINPLGNWQQKIDISKNVAGYEVVVTHCNGAVSKYLVR